jgi:hypothetical protein
MGLFDKKKKGRDDFDSPVEQIDLSAAGAAPAADQGGNEADEAETVERASSAAARARSSRSTDAERRRTRGAPSTYGIDDAIALMRTLPSENGELVVQVVKHTLESARIDIGVIIEDAIAKQQRTESRIAVLRDAIAELEREIDTRRAEIDQLETDNRETTRVKERLVLAEKLTQGGHRPDTVVEPQASGGASLAGRGGRADSLPAPSAPPRARSTSAPPIPASAAPSAGAVNHAGSGAGSGSGNHVVPGPVGPGGPVVGSNAVGPGGPAGSYAHRPSSTHTVVSKK